MEEEFDAIPAAYRTERLGRMRDLIMQIEADDIRYKFLKQVADAGSGNKADLDEIQRKEIWMKRNMNAFVRLNAMSIEGITFVRSSETPSAPYLKK